MTKRRLICFECNKSISKKQGAYVLLGTYNRPSKPDNETYFHFPCFVDWVHKKVETKASSMTNIQQVTLPFQLLSLIEDKIFQKIAENVLKNLSIPQKDNNGKRKKRATKKKKN